MNYYKCNVLDSSLLNLPTWKTMSGNLISFDTSYTNNLRSCNVDISAQQAGSGDPSPSNVRAISGVDEVNIHKLGINLWDEQWELGVFDTSTGADVEASNRIRAKNKIRVKSGTYVSFHSPLSGSNEGLWVIFFDANESVVSGLSFPNSIDHYGNSFMFHSSTILIPQNVAYLRFYVTYQYGTTYQDDISINASKTDTTYHAYTDTVTTVTLPETIYGGSGDLVNGNGTAVYALITLTGQETGANYAWNSYTFTNLLFEGSNDGVRTLFCSHTKNHITGLQMYNTSTTSDYPDAVCVSTGSNVRFRNSACTSLSDYQTWLQQQATNGTPVQIVAKLATPTAFTFTGANIPTLAGTNNIYADTGDISVTAEMTLQEYINQL